MSASLVRGPRTPSGSPTLNPLSFSVICSWRISSRLRFTEAELPYRELPYAD